MRTENSLSTVNYANQAKTTRRSSADMSLRANRGNPPISADFLLGTKNKGKKRSASRQGRKNTSGVSRNSCSLRRPARLGQRG